MSARQENEDLDSVELARAWAIDNEEDTEGWSDDDFFDYFQDGVGWEDALEVQWSGGSFAGVLHYRGVFVTYNEVEKYGPYSSFGKARDRLQISGTWDTVSHYYVDPSFEDLH